ncbi:hypothetical protein PG989_004191 [Apiospora arundinis]
MASLSFVPSLPTNPEAFLPPKDAASAGASRAPLVRGVAIFCMLVLTVITSLRLYTRRFIQSRIGLDDYLAVVAWVSGKPVNYEDPGQPSADVPHSSSPSWPWGALYITHTKYGLGGHIWEPMGPEDLMISLQLVFAEGLLYNISLMAIKIALVSQYFRLISGTKYRIPCLVLAALLIIWCLGMISIVIFGCYPVQSAWDFTIADRDCTTASHGIVIGIGNIITDFILILLPVPIIWKLKITTGQKLVIICIFSIGSFACVVSILRLTFLQITDDFSYSAAIIDCWTIGELSAACSCPSLMVLQPLLKKLGIYLSTFRRSSYRRSDAPGETTPFSRKTGFGPLSRKIGSQPDMPENMHGSEVELCSLESATKRDGRHAVGLAVRSRT